MIDILMGQYRMPRKVAIELVQGLMSKKKTNRLLCFRDLKKWAEDWRKYQPQETVSVKLKPLPQVGSMCKVVAIANIDRFFAELAIFSALPVRKLKERDISLRQLQRSGDRFRGKYSPLKDGRTFAKASAMKQCRSILDLKTFINF